MSLLKELKVFTYQQGPGFRAGDTTQWHRNWNEADIVLRADINEYWFNPSVVIAKNILKPVPVDTAGRPIPEINWFHFTTQDMPWVLRDEFDLTATGLGVELLKWLSDQNCPRCWGTGVNSRCLGKCSRCEGTGHVAPNNDNFVYPETPLEEYLRSLR